MSSDSEKGSSAGPAVPNSVFVERAGIRAVDRIVFEEARCLWRETPNHDVGIDGQIEHVSEQDRVATGRIVAVQVKSGASYFVGEKADMVPYRPEARHRSYWAKFPLPVVLVLHDPDTNRTIWTDARAALRSGEGAVMVPIRQRLDREGVLTALAIEGPLPTEHQSPLELLADMIEARFDDPGFDLSYFDLFFNGLTDIAHSVYFGMDLVTELIEYRAYKNGVGWGIGPSAYEFLDSYVEFLVARDLAEVDFAAWTQMASDLGMTGTFVVPLSRYGREVVAAAAKLDARLPHPGSESVVVRERPIRMEMIGIVERADQMGLFQEQFPKLRDSQTS
jgi:hypothetical protein